MDICTYSCMEAFRFKKHFIRKEATDPKGDQESFKRIQNVTPETFNESRKCTRGSPKTITEYGCQNAILVRKPDLLAAPFLKVDTSLQRHRCFQCLQK